MAGEQERCVVASDELSRIKSDFIFSAQTRSCVTDVTLLCEDGELEAHRIILSSSSKFFDRVFRRTKSDKPVIFLKGFFTQRLKHIIEFIYLGRTEMNSENLASFLDKAKDLEIEGLLDDHSNSLEQDPIEENISLESFRPGSKAKIKSEPIKTTGEYKNLENGVSNISENSDEKKEKMKLKRKSASTSASGENVCYYCQKCFASTGSLTNHVMNIHEGVRYRCVHCGLHAGQAGNIKHHIGKTHPGMEVRYTQVNLLEMEKNLISKYSN